MPPRSRAEKLRQLNTFRRKRPQVSASALASTLQGARDEGIPDLVDRKSIRKARDFIASEMTPFGEIVQYLDVRHHDGSPIRIPYAYPAAFLFAALTCSVPLLLLFSSQLQIYPSSPENPWRLVLYSDEVTPGNVLNPNNERKFQAVYFTFLELGIHALSREEAWFPIMTEYSKVINRVEGNMSCVFGKIVKAIFDPDRFDLQTAGIRLPDGTRLWAKLSIFLQDGAAHKLTWNSRAGACRLCLLCKNVFTEQSEFADADGTKLLRCNVVHESGLVKATDADLRATARYLESKSGTMRKTPFTTLQQALGMTYVVGSLLLDRSLDSLILPTLQYMHDWMHTLYADGIANRMVYLLFESFLDAGHRTHITSHRGYLGHCSHQNSIRRTLHSVFHCKRIYIKVFS